MLFFPWLREVFPPPAANRWEDFPEETFFLLDLERDFLTELLDDLLLDRSLLAELEALEDREDFPPPARTEATCTDPFW